MFLGVFTLQIYSKFPDIRTVPYSGLCWLLSAHAYKSAYCLLNTTKQFVGLVFPKALIFRLARNREPRHLTVPGLFTSQGLSASRGRIAAFRCAPLAMTERPPYAIIFSRCLMRLSLFTAVGTTVTTTYLEVGVLLILATLVMGTNGLASGK